MKDTLRIEEVENGFVVEVGKTYAFENAVNVAEFVQEWASSKQKPVNSDDPLPLENSEDAYRQSANTIRF